MSSRLEFLILTWTLCACEKLLQSSYCDVFPEKGEELVVDRRGDGRQRVERLSQHSDCVLVVAECPEVLLEIHWAHDDLVLIAHGNRLLRSVLVEAIIKEGKSEKRAGSDDVCPLRMGVNGDCKIQGVPVKEICNFQVVELEENCNFQGVGKGLSRNF